VFNQFRILLVMLLLIIIFSCNHNIIDKQNITLDKKEKKQDLKTNPQFNEIDTVYFKTKPESLISTRNPDDILKIRERLNEFIWGTTTIPFDILPAKIENNIKDERYENETENILLRIDRVLVEMDFGLESYIYYFVPKQSNQKIVLFHQGHGGDFIINRDFILQLLGQGYSVAAFCMPLKGLNNKPTVYLPRFGYFKITSHDHLKLLQPEKGHPVKYFLLPIVAFLNYLDNEFNYQHVAMAGISGGGWTTTLISAIDTRIQTSFPIAGTYPLYLRSDCSRDWGDWEQSIPELYRVANYLELYILGAFGENRSQLQILNKYDSCCFAGIKWQTYADVVFNLMKSLDSGSWGLVMDDSHFEHKISQISRDKIISVLNTK
jgi:hypothetical protein